MQLNVFIFLFIKGEPIGKNSLTQSILFNSQSKTQLFLTTLVMYAIHIGNCTFIFLGFNFDFYRNRPVI